MTLKKKCKAKDFIKHTQFFWQGRNYYVIKLSDHPGDNNPEKACCQ